MQACCHLLSDMPLLLGLSLAATYVMLHMPGKPNTRFLAKLLDITDNVAAVSR
jgi:hypothetical protein